MMAPSPIATCPPKVAPFTSVTLSPMSQSWAMWQPIIRKQLAPTLVAIWPLSVPGLIVTYSRISVFEPMVRVLGSSWNLMSWGAAPSDTKGNTLQPAPSVVRLVMLAWECTTTPSPSTTCGPITQNGPISTFVPSFAPGSTRAVA